MRRALPVALAAGLVLALAGVVASSLQTQRAPAPAREVASVVAPQAAESQPQAQPPAAVRLGARGPVLERPPLVAARVAPSVPEVPMNPEDVRPPLPEGPPAGWDAEEPDPEATDELTRYFAESMSELEVDGAIDGLTCRKTLCRVNVHFSSLGQALKFESTAGLTERRRALNYTVTDGVVDVEVFLARE